MRVGVMDEGRNIQLKVLLSEKVLKFKWLKGILIFVEK